LGNAGTGSKPAEGEEENPMIARLKAIKKD
jgi:hypothetical protein